MSAKSINANIYVHNKLRHSWMVFDHSFLLPVNINAISFTVNNVFPPFEVSTQLNNDRVARQLPVKNYHRSKVAATSTVSAELVEPCPLMMII